MNDLTLPGSSRYRVRVDSTGPDQSVPASLHHEWLQTNGVGGYACGTVAGANTRRYHGLLVASMNPPTDRFVLVNKIEETVRLGEDTYEFDVNQYPGTVHPTGYHHLDSFRAFPHPTWVYRINDHRITREIICVEDENTTVIRWTLKQGEGPVQLTARPMLSARNYHSLQTATDRIHESVETEPRKCTWPMYSGGPSIHARHTGKYQHHPDWYYQIVYPIENQRGLGDREDWWTPGRFQFKLDLDHTATLAFSTEQLTGSEDEAFEQQEGASGKLLVTTTTTSGDSSSGHELTMLRERLFRAADQFVVRRGQGRTVLAGYPWFTDWGRDTFISLPGLLLVTKKYQTAKTVLETFAGHIDKGMIPNRFPDQGDQLEYNTIDASLWYIDALGRYVEQTSDDSFARQTGFGAVRSIIEGYSNGTRYEIHEDDDGLIYGGSPSTQLTWMDAEVHAEPVTPRDGKPVEIQALWIRALQVAASLANRFGRENLRQQYLERRRQVIDSFRDRFLFSNGGYLYDVVDGHRGEDPRLRPNQLYAVSLCDDIVPVDWARSIVNNVNNQLWTPYGLRTLSPDQDQYVGVYAGSPEQRDAAYHQGTVWMYLLGPFISSWVRVHGDRDGAREDYLALFEGVKEHLMDRCIGSASEIFDGDPPYEPRGCFAQAWSVAEPLRALEEGL